LHNPTQTKSAVFGLGTGASQFLGGSGDLNLYTQGTGAGGIRIGTASVQRIGIDAAGKVNFSNGNLSGSGRWNFFQAGNAIGDGIRLHNTNTGFFLDVNSQANGWNQISSNGNVNMLLEPAVRGAVVIGNTASALGKLHIQQSAGVSGEGLYISYGGGIIRNFVDSSGSYNIQSGGTQLQLRHDDSTFQPAADQGVSLGRSANRWGQFYCMQATISGPLAIAGSLTGVTTLSVNGAITGVTTLTASGTITAGGFSTGGGSLSVGGNISGANITASGQFSGGTYAHIIPTNDTTYNVGSSVNKWANVYSSAYWKPGGGNGFLDPSDDALKLEESFRPYEKGLSELLALRPTYFRFTGEWGTSSEAEYVGLRAQELQQVLPEMIGTHVRQKDPYDEQSEQREFMHVDSSDLQYIMLNAIKELSAKVDDLERRVAERTN
jgi:hypothetical protein